MFKSSHVLPMSINTDTFSLQIKLNKAYLKMLMQMRTETVNTCEIPHAFSMLKKSLPSILKAECFNEYNIPFYEEVKKTEMGHLFEHILLEYLCLTKLEKGFKQASFSGRTHWNWKKEKRGSFHIHIGMPVKDLSFIPEALEKSLILFKQISEPIDLDTLYPTYTEYEMKATS